MGKMNILVVEDETYIGISIRKRLEKIGLNVIMVVPSGDEAYQISSERVPDLVLMDIGLEGNLDGLETARTLWRHFSVPVIVVTGNISFPRSPEFSESWCYGYTPKPLHDWELERIVSSAIHKILIERNSHLPTTVSSLPAHYNPMEQCFQSGILPAEYSFILKDENRLLPIQTFYLFSESNLTNRSDTDRHLQEGLISTDFESSGKGLDSFGKVDMRDYLSHLAFLLWNRSNPTETDSIHLSIDSESLYFQPREAISLGIILAESLGNSLQFAFPENENRMAKEIYIRFGISKSQDKCFLQIRDNGIGLKTDNLCYPNMTESIPSGLHGGLGIKIIRGLADLLGSDFILSGDQGTYLEINFPVPNYIYQLK